MAKEEQTTVVQDSTQQAQATPEEQELNRLALERARSAQPGQIEAQSRGLNLINQLLVGGELPGFLQQLPGGISPEITTEISQQAVSDIAPQFQQAGILDSGVAAAVSGQVAGDIRRGAQEFNIGNLLNLLNLAVGGQAQIQQPLLAQTAQLGQRLAGLRPITQTGSTTQTSPNPFLSSFQTSLGTSLGSALVPSFQTGPFTFGG